jgi:DNA-binding GntR family transcriptional regulator
MSSAPTSPANRDEPQLELARTMAERIEHAIRRDLLSGVLAPGSRLRIKDLSEAYGVSPIPVREALRQLEGDRIVVMESHRGAVLRDVDRKFAQDMYDLRGAIEALTVRRAVQAAKPTDIDKLKTLRDEYEAIAAGGDQRAMLAANQRLHNFIGYLADNPAATRLMEQGWDLIVAIRSRFGFGGPRIACIIGEHRRLVDAIERGQSELAVAIAQEHCEGAKQDLLQQMERAGL